MGQKTGLKKEPINKNAHVGECLKKKIMLWAVLVMITVIGILLPKISIWNQME
jgi:hypothetical protein